MSAPRLAKTLAAVLLFITSISLTGVAQTLAPTSKPLPFDQGEQGLKQQLRKLQTTGRLLQIDAHPDDEDGDMLAMMARGKGYSVTLLTITRGEGGQNRLGSALFDALGVLRTLELLESDKYYGVEQRFTRMADFGFSKSPQETIQKWGHDAALADVVRVIREVQPDVVVAKFAGDERDGHGHHQASAILAREAFRAAGDPKMFPEHMKEGLQPWQAKKFYMRGFPEDHTLAFDTNVMDPVIGMTYTQLQLEGLRHQQSQLSGNFTLPSGPRIRYYKLVDSTLPNVKPGIKEKEFFEGIDVSLRGLTETAPQNVRVKASEMISKLQRATQDAEAATERHDGKAATKALLTAGANCFPSITKGWGDFTPAWSKVCFALGRAVNLAAGCSVKVSLDGVQRGPRFASVIPNTVFNVSAASHCDVPIPHLVPMITAPRGWTVTMGRYDDNSAMFRVTVPRDAAITRQHWERDNPETDTRYRVTDPRVASLPLKRLPVHVSNGARGIQGGDFVPLLSFEDVPLIVVPPIAVTTTAATEVLPKTAQRADVGVNVRNTSTAASEATARVTLPPGWNAQPETQTLHFAKPDDKQDVTFHVTAPQQQSSGTLHLTAIAERNGTQYSDGFEIVTRDDLGAYPYFAPAQQRISVVDVKVPQDLRVGYIMGAGDDIPTVLRQVGMKVSEISPQELASGDLSKYGTIVVGIRAYDTQEGVRKNNHRLLDYVNNGGTLVVQYNADIGQLNSEHVTPFPCDFTRDRVSQEEQPVQILAPDDSVFRFPNQITEHDFEGWVQERGLYFADKWDDQYKPLLACNDPGEPLRKGGMLRAKYGKGTYIYTGYAFFRQLPVGVPGAVRLFVNLVSAGHETAVASGK